MLEFDSLNSTLKEKDFTTLHKFKCHRYIDDLLAANNAGELEKFKERIYPPELKLTSEDKNDQKVTTYNSKLKNLPLTINYRKRDNFGFSTVNFPDLHGNRQVRVTEFLFPNLSDILECQNIKDFKERTSNLVDRLKKQGFRLLCQTSLNLLKDTLTYSKSKRF